MRLDPDIERDLIARARGGAPDAFADLAAAYQQRLFRFLCVRARCAADAEDALQESLVAAWRYLHTYRDRWKFSTWLYRIAIRHLAKASETLEPPNSNETQPVAPDDPLRWSSDSETAHNLWAVAKDVLDDESLTALWLRYGEDLPVKEIAGAMSRGQPWVKVRLLRARRRLERTVLVRELAADRCESLLPLNGQCQ